MNFTPEEIGVFTLGNHALVHITKVLNDVDIAMYIRILEQLQTNKLHVATDEQLMDVDKLLSMARKLNEIKLEAKSWTI